MDDWRYAQCAMCEREFLCHPEFVPHLFGRPVCALCMDVVNTFRAADGLPLVQVHPDAYRPAEL